MLARAGIEASEVPKTRQQGKFSDTSSMRRLRVPFCRCSRWSQLRHHGALHRNLPLQASVLDPRQNGAIAQWATLLLLSVNVRGPARIAEPGQPRFRLHHALWKWSLPQGPPRQTDTAI